MALKHTGEAVEAVEKAGKAGEDGGRCHGRFLCMKKECGKSTAWHNDRLQEFLA